jgi:cytochrome c peroxidase
LGNMLFFDPRLSGSGMQSCATCHNPAFGWEDGMALGTGHEHKKLKRATPTVENLAWDELYFWDGRAESLEAQTLIPIESDVEMHMTKEKMINMLEDIKEYKPLFEKAFPGESDPINENNVAKAIATFERGIVSEQAPFDLWIEGDEQAISEAAKRGFTVFNKKANCAACHSGWQFSDGSFHDIGLDTPDIGRGKFVPQLLLMQKAFKTTGLRNIERRAPYMHNGSLKTLEEVIDHYDHGFIQRDSLSEEIKPLDLTAEEKADLIAFLKTLTSEDTPVTIPVLPK